MQPGTSLWLGVILAVLVASLTIASASWGQTNDSEKHNPIVSSWHVRVSFDDGRPDVMALYTFNSDQTFTMGGSWPSQFGPGHGAWSGVGGQSSSSVDLTFFRLLYSPGSTPPGAFNGTLKVQAKLDVSDDGQSFAGRYLLQSFDAAGNPRSSATGSLNALRINVEPLP